MTIAEKPIESNDLPILPEWVDTNTVVERLLNIPPFELSDGIHLYQAGLYYRKKTNFTDLNGKAVYDETILLSQAEIEEIDKWNTENR